MIGVDIQNDPLINTQDSFESEIRKIVDIFIKNSVSTNLRWKKIFFAFYSFSQLGVLLWKKVINSKQKDFKKVIFIKHEETMVGYKNVKQVDRKELKFTDCQMCK